MSSSAPALPTPRPSAERPSAERPSAERPPAERPSRRGGLVVALVALGVGVAVLAPLTVFTIRRTTIAERANPAVTVQLSAGAMRFEPAEIHVPRSAVIRVDVSEDDPTSPHDFQTFGQLADTRVVGWPGEVRTAYFKSAAQPGRYPFICTLRGHAEAGMTGVIVVD